MRLLQKSKKVLFCVDFPLDSRMSRDSLITATSLPLTWQVSIQTRR